jgi:hypothetical protein
MKGKELWEIQNDQLNDFAGKALQGMLAGLYSNQGMLEVFAQTASEEKLSVNKMMAKRSYEIAQMMLRTKDEFELQKPIK